MDMSMVVDAELRAATAEAKYEAMEAEMKQCVDECTALKVSNAALGAKLEAQAEAMKQSERLCAMMIAGLKDAFTVPEVEQTQPQWEVSVRRDGANQMLGAVLKPIKGE